MINIMQMYEDDVVSKDKCSYNKRKGFEKVEICVCFVTLVFFVWVL